MTRAKLNHLAATKIMGWQRTKSDIGNVGYRDPANRNLLVQHQRCWKPCSSW